MDGAINQHKRMAMGKAIPQPKGKNTPFKKGGMPKFEGRTCVFGAFTHKGKHAKCGTS